MYKLCYQKYIKEKKMSYYFLLAEFCISLIHITAEDALSSHFPEIKELAYSN